MLKKVESTSKLSCIFHVSFYAENKINKNHIKKEISVGIAVMKKGSKNVAHLISTKPLTHFYSGSIS